MKKYYIIFSTIILLVLGSWYFKSGSFTSDPLGGNNQITYPEPDTTGLPKVYESDLYRFKINLPEDFIIDEDYKYESVPSRVFPGVKFTVPERLHKGTNLSSDSYVSVEKLSYDSMVCTASSFLDSSEPKKPIKVNGQDFTGAYSISAGAGNRYEETVYTTQVTDGCLAVRYFIHYGVIQNYPEGSVKEFDKDALIKLFDSIRETLVIR